MSIMNKLTPRQKEIVTLLVQSHTQAETARTLDISPHTVRNHLVIARRETGCSSTLELAVKFCMETINAN